MKKLLNKELELGIKIESEHGSTVKFIKNFFKKYGKLPTNKQIYTSIAKDHLKEDKYYYKKLKQCKL